MTAAPHPSYDLVAAEHDFPLRAEPPRRTILICTHPRSGSTLLGEAVYFAEGSDGALGCPLEYFHVGFRPTLEQRWGVSDIGNYIAAVHRHRTSPDGTLAVKLFWRDVAELAAELAPGRFPDLVATAPRDVPAECYRDLMTLLDPIFPNPQLVHLVREDRVRQAVSAAVATNTGVWRSIPGVDDRAPAREPAFDYEQIERLIAYSDACHGHWRNYFAVSGTPPITVTYETLVTDYAGTVGDLVRRLGGSGASPSPRMRRQGGSTSEAMVARFLREHFSRQRIAANASATVS